MVCKTVAINSNQIDNKHQNVCSPFGHSYNQQYNTVPVMTDIPPRSETSNIGGHLQALESTLLVCTYHFLFASDLYMRTDHKKGKSQNTNTRANKSIFLQKRLTCLRKNMTTALFIHKLTDQLKKTLKARHYRRIQVYHAIMTSKHLRVETTLLHIARATTFSFFFLPLVLIVLLWTHQIHIKM